MKGVYHFDTGLTAAPVVDSRLLRPAAPGPGSLRRRHGIARPALRLGLLVPDLDRV
jgi:hypothetical protein